IRARQRRLTRLQLRARREPGSCRTVAGCAEIERSLQATLGRVAELLREVVGNGAASEFDAGPTALINRRKAVRILAIAHRVDTLELDREVGRAAVFLRIEAVRLAASGRADERHHYADAAQAVDDRLARRARIRPGDDEHAIQ